MSLHFEYALAFDLRPDVPLQVLDTLRYMLREEDYAFDDLPAHRFFEGSAWRLFLSCRSSHDQSGWVPCAGEVGGVLRRAFRYGPDGPGYRHTLSFRCFMLDDQFYDGFDFLGWLASLSETVGFVGYFREERNLNPTLIYFKGGKAYLAKAPRQLLEMTTGDPW